MTRQEINHLIAETLKGTKINYQFQRGDVGYKASKCQITKNGQILTEGVSIYAPTDKFSLSDGKKKAKFRAIQALFHKFESGESFIEPVRPWLALMFDGFLCSDGNNAFKGIAHELTQN